MQIEFQSVYFSYNKKIDTINNVSLMINSGDRIFIHGKTGAGKTTLLNLLSANNFPDKGYIFINQKNIKLLSKNKLNEIKKSIGSSKQIDYLIPDINCYENLTLTSMIVNSDKKDINKRTLEVLAGMKISYLRSKYPNELSAGEKKLITMARSLINNPKLVIIDEPLENLSISEIELPLKYIIENSDKESILIIASHHVELLTLLPDFKKVTLNDGKIS
jgi:ABC-type lipoprotein export system ATPase subunit